MNESALARINCRLIGRAVLPRPWSRFLRVSSRKDGLSSTHKYHNLLLYKARLKTEAARYRMTSVTVTVTVTAIVVASAQLLISLFLRH
jgi:hypothetical protein